MAHIAFRTSRLPFAARMSIVHSALLVACSMGPGGCAVHPAQSATTQAASPIAYRHEIRADPKLHLYIVTIDLTDPRVELCAAPAGPDPDGDGPWQVTLQTVREIAKREDLDVAVNGNFFTSHKTINLAGRRVPYFAGNWARAVGWLVADGKVISSEAAAASVVIDGAGKVRIAQFERLPVDARHVVSGSQQVLTGGRITARGDARVPRTGVGISADGARLVLLVVDGRLLSHSVGISETELAREMLALGCSDAINLDGGGSSTLVMKDEKTNTWKLLNRPSDGHDLPIPLSLERPVACVLGARIKPNPE